METRYQCNYPGPDSAVVTNILETITSSLQSYICNFPGCKYRTFTPVFLDNHEKRHKNCRDPTTKDKVQCHQCDYLAENPSRLTNHMKVHSDQKPFSCTVPGCDYKARWQHSIESHQKLGHEDEKTVWYECDKCDFRTKHERALKREHSRLHADVRIPKKFKCELCDYDDDKRCRLKDHMRKHTGENKSFPCNIPGCDFTGNCKSSVYAHKKVVHWEKTWFRCDQCPYQTFHKSWLTQHMKIHSETKPFSCTFEGCEYSSTTKANLRAHLNNHDYDDRMDVSSSPGRGQKQCSQLTSKVAMNLKRYPCTHPGCDYVAKAKSHFSRHLQTHDPNRTRSLKCPLCPKLFFAQDARKVHLRRHTKEKPLKCSYPDCDHRGYNSSELKKHEHVHQAEKSFRCAHPGCSYSATRESYLRRHSQTHVPNRERKFQCNLCTRSFHSGSGLQNHVFSHTKEKPFKCTLCRYASAQHNFLNKHRCPENLKKN